MKRKAPGVACFVWVHDPFARDMTKIRNEFWIVSQDRERSCPRKTSASGIGSDGDCVGGNNGNAAVRFSTSENDGEKAGRFKYRPATRGKRFVVQEPRFGARTPLLRVDGWCCLLLPTPRSNRSALESPPFLPVKDRLVFFAQFPSISRSLRSSTRSLRRAASS